MGQTTKIEWADATFNPWQGCARVSRACRFCYAERDLRRWGLDLFRRRGPRRITSAAYWRQPLKWNRDAERAGQPIRVFCASQADVFEDHPDLPAARARLWPLIEATPWLRWLLLTKRPQNVAQMAPWGASWPEHIWLGTSVEDQTNAADRIPHLLAVPARVRFLSAEPLVGPLDLTPWLKRPQIPACDRCDPGGPVDYDSGHLWGLCRCDCHPPIPGIDWIIAGGESGPAGDVQPMHPAWTRRLRDDCHRAQVPFFFKQWGTYAPYRVGTPTPAGLHGPLTLVDPAGGTHSPKLGALAPTGSALMAAYGKHRAGRILDGRTHDDLPEAP